MTVQSSRAGSALLGGGLVIGGIVVAETLTSVGGGAATLAVYLHEFWNRIAWPAVLGVRWAASGLWHVMLRSVSLVGPNPALQTMVLTLLLGLGAVAFFVFLAVVAGPLSGRQRGRNPLEPPADGLGQGLSCSGRPGATDATGEPPLEPSDSPMGEVPQTPENRSKLLQTAGALRELIRTRPGLEPANYETDLLRVEDFVVTNRLTEAYLVLDRVSREISDETEPGTTRTVPRRAERWTDPPRPNETGAVAAAPAQRWTGAPPSKGWSHAVPPDPDTTPSATGA